MAFDVKTKKKEAVVVSSSDDYIAIRKKGNKYEVQSFASDLFNKEKTFSSFSQAKTFLKKEVKSYLEGEVSNEEKVAKEMMKDAKVEKVK